MSPNEALNRLTRSKNDKRLADIVRADAAQKQEDFEVLHTSYEYVSDQWMAEHERTHSILVRLEEIADMPNGKAKNQLRRLLRELTGQLISPDDDDISVPSIMPDGAPVYDFPI